MLAFAVALLVTALFAYMLGAVNSTRPRVVVVCEWLAAICGGAAGLALVAAAWQHALAAL